MMLWSGDQVYATFTLLPLASYSEVMDESSESPIVSRVEKIRNHTDQKEDSGDEDEILDWSKLAPKGTKTQNLPKRGEKAFEPITMGPSAYQKFTLDQARQAMYDALSPEREIQTKRLSQALWMPKHFRARVIDARGTTFNGFGYTTKRPGDTEKRLELLPEEALYMVERGSMLCWKESQINFEEVLTQEGDPIKVIGAPMSVQQAFAEMLGAGDVTLEHYQVYSYLKRFGYIVRRAQSMASSEDYKVYHHLLPGFSLSKLIKAKLAEFWSMLGRFLAATKVFFRPEIHYPVLFRSFRIIKTTPPVIHPSNKRISPYHVFFHIWKPNAVWNRSLPTRPDFDVVVINARKTMLPSITDLTALFGTAPLALPVYGAPSSKIQPLKRRPNIFLRIYQWLLYVLKSNSYKKADAFPALKSGRKSVIFAVVDMGTISMYRFNEGCFEEWPMI